MPTHTPLPSATSEPHAERWAVVWRYARWVLWFGVPALVLWLVWHEVHALDPHRVRGLLRECDPRLALAGTLAAFAGVGVMGLYDAIAFPRGAAGRLGFGKRWFIGAVVFGWTNFVSLGPIGGPAMRLFVYRRAGLTGSEVTRGFVGHGIGAASGLAAWLLAAWLPLGPSGGAVVVRVLIAAGVSVLLPVAIGRAVVPFLRRHRYGTELTGLPLARLGAVSFVDWGLTLASFVLLIRAVGVVIGGAEAARIVFTGQFAGLISMIPGGIGSADGVWFKGFDLLGVPHDAAAAAVVAFRAGFYLAPWIASVCVIYFVAMAGSARLRIWQRRLIAGVVMVNVGLLLLSAATPATRGRLDAVARVIPLGAIEASHALSVATAAVMLFLVRGLIRGYRSAYIMTLAMLIASTVAHLLKGGDFEESVASAVLSLMLIGSRKAFPRRGRTPIGWDLTLAAGMACLAIFVISGFVAFERIPYRPELWTHFAERAEASRFLRGAVLLALIVTAAIVRQAVRPVSLFITPTPEDIVRAEGFAERHATSADPLLIGGADKGVWFYAAPGDPSGPLAMFLFQRRGDRLVVFKDPVLAAGVDPGPAIDAFLRYAEELDVDVVFSMISPEWMGQLHDFGFHFLKVAQEAVVPLTGFTLQGGKNAGFRRTIREVEKIGIRYEVIEPPFDAPLMDSLRAVSDAWLASKGGRELQFSACCFSPAYIQRNPLGVARDADGRVVAFVNLLLTRPGGPATLDLMRYAPGVADNLMDFVVVRAMQTAADRGATSFSLGGAPLSDVGVWRGSRLAERFLRIFATRAERIYNYQGLLNYKTKFHPEWEPRYIAFEQPWDWATALLANARLVEARSKQDRHRIAWARMAE